MIIIGVYDSFYNTGKDGKVKVETGNKEADFNHAMVIVGWKQIGGFTYWKVQNSWGPDWGDNGYCYIVQGSKIILDMYTVTDAKNIK
jgi:C1A family cysteine protease